MSDAYERIVDALTHWNVRETGHGQARAKCPAHNGQSNDSLAVRAIEGQVLIHCHSGCSTRDVVAALDLTMSDLFDDTAGVTYRYDDGRTVHRSPTKKFRQSGNTHGTALYRAERVAEAVAAGETIFVVEGEKDVHAIEALGGTAVCSAMGAGKAHLADWSPLRGANVVIIQDKDDPGRQHAREVSGQLTGVAKTVEIVEAKLGKDAADHIAAGHGLGDFAAAPEGRAVTVRLADVQPERVEWLWPGRIPLGKLVVLDGDPNLGKSTLSLAFAAVVTTGGLWPDGSWCEYPGAVVLLSAEDGLADTVRPRLDAAGADVTRVHAVQELRLPNGTAKSPTLADVAYLEEVVTRTGARLLIIDVLMAYLPGGVDSHKDQDIRSVLAELAKMAERTGCTVLLLRHLNKVKGSDPLYRGGGSIGIVGAVRAGLLVAPNPDDDSSSVLATVKNNLAPKSQQGSIVYRLVDSGIYGVAKVEWLGNSDHNARALLANSSDGGDGGNFVTEAENWLEDYLTEQGAAPSKDVKVAAKKAGISERTIERAAQKLRVEFESRGFPRATWWSLPSRATTLEGPAVTQNLGATGATGADLGKWVGATGGISQSRQPVCDGATGGATADPTGAEAAPKLPKTICPACGYDSVPEGHTMHFDCARLAAENRKEGK